ncbi:FecCD family ABC transporter permease [Allorhizobium borbori]|uniref:Iron complex transport system permease protein n=1 Tax=Allorhizobium borbori TaxID=485907 RepID=A0A7W6K6V9_9HYPH|nr:iron ABC transporter permease [Allorhizobium borbori]MBB4105200.1 iron complex transport system permease protein [Allorhizobium borbori]
MKSRRILLATALLSVPALLLASLILGDQTISRADLASLLDGSASVQTRMIVLDLRLPRALMAFTAGMALGIAGAIAQAVMRNPLAEPGILGINAGAALAGGLVIVGLKGAGAALLPLAGFAGATLMATFVFILSWRNGTSSLRIVLIGIALGALAGAGCSFLIAFADVADVQRLMIWLAGSVYAADWGALGLLVAWLVVPVALACLATRQLDLLRFGDDIAASLGQRVNLGRALLILLCTAISGATVAACGLIGFIGLIAPHVARKMAGAGHARLIPASALVGGLLLMAADLVARTVMAPAQLPAGIVTALIGAPFLGYLLWGRRHAAQ